MGCQHLPNVCDSGLCRESCRTGAEPRGPRPKPGSRRPEGRGRLRTSGVRPIPSRRQFASGRSGPAAGRWAVGRLDGTRQAPRPSRRGRSRAGPGRSGGGRACAPAAPSAPVLGKGDSVQSPVRTVEPVGRRRGVGAGPALPLPGAHGTSRSSAEGPTGDRGQGKGLRGRRQRQKRWR